MQSPLRPSSRDTVRESILAQLDTLRCGGHRASDWLGSNRGTLHSNHGRQQQQPPPPPPPQKLQLLRLPSSPQHGSGLTHGRATTASFAVAPPVPNTRRLPPLFAEQWHNTAEIHSVCNGLQSTLLQLDADFARGGGPGALGGSPLAFAGGAALNTLLLHQQQQRRRRNRGASAHGRRDMGDQVSDERVLLELEVQQRMEDIQRIRIAAADEGLSDEQSVNDYAEEPDVPRFVPGIRLREEVEAMEESLRKISESIATMMAIEERDAGNPWWSSAMLTREMKASGIRANYHARRVLKWNQRAREHFLVEAVVTNEQSARCRADMLYLREQQELFLRRIELCHKAQAEIAAELAALQEALREANHAKGELQQQLVARSHERQLLPRDCEDALRAEFLLLLDYVAWPAALQADADRVKAWVRENAVPLDV
ncbi:hypothetical protein DQ04_14081000 [Trypanosoma grayi]|uniref:hypothetical protein n=1 Tax=Trypanosoma grayi TaxID=71804 RepID=UPI0004F47BAE|nr:hypothetical protein DQ04_14081000 [Trypanosoma grayi]KEG06406.1 hypothetical protein DQ04_14081000 [Trypanosoma grayi]